MWNPVLYVSCKLYCIIFLRLTSSLCCRMLPDIWYVRQPLQYSRWVNEQVYPVQRLRISGMWSQDDSTHSLICAHLWSRLSWDNPRRGRQSCRGDQFPSQSDTLEPDSTVCRRAYWKFYVGLVDQQFAMVTAAVCAVYQCLWWYARGSIPSLSPSPLQV